MNKQIFSTKTWVHVVGILSVVVCLIIAGTILFSDSTPPEEEQIPLVSSTYTIPPKICVAMFGGNPLVLERPVPLFRDFTDFYKAGTVDSNGNFVFTLTADEKRVLRTNCEKAVKKMRKAGATISEDYTSYVLEKDTYLADSSFACEVLNACFFLQMLNDISPEEMNVEWYIIDPTTNETLQHTSWPKHYMGMDFADLFDGFEYYE